MIELELRVTGFYKVRRIVQKLASGEYYRGAFKDTFEHTLSRMRSYAKSIAHRITGWLVRSIDYEYDSRKMVGKLFLDPSYSYLRGNATIQRPSTYGVYEEARGGDHAFMRRTYDRFAGNELVRNLKSRLITEL